MTVEAGRIIEISGNPDHPFNQGVICGKVHDRPGVAVIKGIWCHKFSPDGRGVNVLTSDWVTDLGGGPALHSNLVEVARL